MPTKKQQDEERSARLDHLIEEYRSQAENAAERSAFLGERTRGAMKAAKASLRKSLPAKAGAKKE